MLLLPEGQTGESWEPSSKSALTEFGGRWMGKRFYLLFK